MFRETQLFLGLCWPVLIRFSPQKLQVQSLRKKYPDYVPVICAARHLPDHRVTLNAMRVRFIRRSTITIEERFQKVTVLSFFRFKVRCSIVLHPYESKVGLVGLWWESIFF